MRLLKRGAGSPDLLNLENPVLLCGTLARRHQTRDSTICLEDVKGLQIIHLKDKRRELLNACDRWLNGRDLGALAYPTVRPRSSGVFRVEYLTGRPFRALTGKSGLGPHQNVSYHAAQAVYTGPIPPK
jgi:hypothetical protein